MPAKWECYCKVGVNTQWEGLKAKDGKEEVKRRHPSIIVLES